MQLEKANVLFGDAVESDIMNEARIADADIVFSVTNSDEINTLVSVLSKKAGAKNCYALLNQDKYNIFIFAKRKTENNVKNCKIFYENLRNKKKLAHIVKKINQI